MTNIYLNTPKMCGDRISWTWHWKQQEQQQQLQQRLPVNQLKSAIIINDPCDRAAAARNEINFGLKCSLIVALQQPHPNIEVIFGIAPKRCSWFIRAAEEAGQQSIQLQCWQDHVQSATWLSCQSKWITYGGIAFAPPSSKVKGLLNWSGANNCSWIRAISSVHHSLTVGDSNMMYRLSVLTKMMNWIYYHIF